jgi:hypothetical protein
MKASARLSRASYCGNALMEYAVPAAIIMLSSGLLITVTGATDLMAGYYLSVSGRTFNSLEGEIFKTRGLADRAVGSAGNGATAFGSNNLGSLIDGSGTAVVSNEGGVFYLGDMSRPPGNRPISSSPDYLYP